MFLTLRGKGGGLASKLSILRPVLRHTLTSPTGPTRHVYFFNPQASAPPQSTVRPWRGTLAIPIARWGCELMKHRFNSRSGVDTARRRGHTWAARHVLDRNGEVVLARTSQTKWGCTRSGRTRQRATQARSGRTHPCLSVGDDSPASPDTGRILKRRSICTVDERYRNGVAAREKQLGFEGWFNPDCCLGVK